MPFKIELDDLVGNAFIILRQKGDDSTFISFRKLEEYGDKVIEVLNKRVFDGFTCLNRDLTDEFFYEYRDLFAPMIVNREKGVVLTRMYDRSCFIRRFQASLPLDLLLAFISDEAASVLIKKT